jgi:hypothetical protein
MLGASGIGMFACAWLHFQTKSPEFVIVKRKKGVYGRAERLLWFENATGRRMTLYSSSFEVSSDGNHHAHGSILAVRKL